MASKSPDAFRTISEVADWLGVQPHVLRFWESKFSQVKPVKRAGGRRYYRPNDMLLIGGIKQLLHEDGLTIKGAQKVLREHGMAHVSAMSKPLDEESAALALEAEKVPADSGDVPEADFIEAPETEATVTAFPATEPELAVQPEQTGDAAPEVEAAPLESAPEPVAEPEPVAPADPVVALDDAVDTTLDLPLGAASETAIEPDEPALPSFITDAPADPVAPAADNMPPPASLDVADAPAIADETAEIQPEFEDFTAPVDADAVPDINETHDDAGHQTAPKPQIVDAPDPVEDNIAVSASTLSAAFGAKSLSAQDRETLTPLIAQLTALRDRMAAARGR